MSGPPSDIQAKQGRLYRGFSKKNIYCYEKLACIIRTIKKFNNRKKGKRLAVPSNYLVLKRL